MHSFEVQKPTLIARCSKIFIEYLFICLNFSPFLLLEILCLVDIKRLIDDFALLYNKEFATIVAYLITKDKF